MNLVEVPFDWNDNFSEVAQEDFSMIQKSCLNEIENIYSNTED